MNNNFKTFVQLDIVENLQNNVHFEIPNNLLNTDNFNVDYSKDKQNVNISFSEELENYILDHFSSEEIKQLKNAINDIGIKYQWNMSTSQSLYLIKYEVMKLFN